MKRVLGLIGSPRKSGNCEIMTKEISRNIAEPHELFLLHLSDFNIKSCTGCYQCLFNDSCHLKDDLEIIIDQMKQADAFIIAAPAYVLGANAALKQLLDRSLAFHRHSAEIRRKPAIAVGLAGLKGKAGRTLLDIEGFLMGMGLTQKMSAMVYAALPGEVVLDDHNRQLAKAFAQSLFADAPLKNTIACPLCGSRTFRFSEGNEVQCMLCSNYGSIDMDAGVPRFTMALEDDIALSNEAVINHGQWLMDMKKRFKGVKEELKKIREDYRGEGKRVRPLPQ